MQNCNHNFFEDGLKENNLNNPQDKIKDISNDVSAIFSAAEEIKPAIHRTNRRLNQYDLELIKNSASSDFITNAINFCTISSLKMLKNDKVENLFFKFFPKLRKAKMIKDSMARLETLNKDAKILLDKTIPYGESEMRYDDLIKYLNYANEIQTRLKRKIKN